MDRIEWAKEVKRRQDEFLEDIQEMPTLYALSLVNIIFESVYAHIEINKLRAMDSSTDEYLDECFNMLKKGIKQKIKEEQ